ncbi:hypothetical protein UFOVP27_27 [uncultured Caudovirales phage]|uniref:Uncharacterized protein n=1 Tax=uncultured Caudovirales phage TaxID=2100421 RepID=A0A6J5KLB0_9CAUD|nr:hypothetical protein UFOVP27_27 [uncultured Caudovirales phage]
MPKYSVIFDTSRNGVLSFSAEDDNEAIRTYEHLLTGEVYLDELDDPQEQTEDSSSTFYELRNDRGKLLAE